MDKLVFSCFLLGGLTPDPGPTDPCAVLNGYCDAGVTNVGCNPPPLTGGPSCDGKSAEIVELLEADQNVILGHINSLRDYYASGNYGNAPANRMFKLQWDANLATQAGHNVRSCYIGRDACRNTADYTNVGQFVAAVFGVFVLSTKDKIDTIFNYGITYDAYTNALAFFNSYSASTGTENEANIVNDRSTKVGCALNVWTGSMITIYLVCNFSANVIVGQPVFTTGATAGAGCATKDPTYTSLCRT